MGAALEAAWAGFEPQPRDRDLARLIMASAIFENVDRGTRDVELLAAAATQSLHAAVSSPLLQTALGRTVASMKGARERHEGSLDGAKMHMVAASAAADWGYGVDYLCAAFGE
jgi:hypothetical protein